MTDTNSIIQDAETIAGVAAVVDPQIAAIVAAAESAVAVAQAAIAAVKNLLAGQQAADQLAALNAAHQKLASDVAAAVAKANS